MSIPEQQPGTGSLVSAGSGGEGWGGQPGHPVFLLRGKSCGLRTGLRTLAPRLCQFHHFVPSRVRINAQEWREVSVLSHSASFVCHDDQPCTGHRGTSPEKSPVISGCVTAALWFAIGLWLLGTSDPKQARQAGWRHMGKATSRKRPDLKQFDHPRPVGECRQYPELKWQKTDMSSRGGKNPTNHQQAAGSRPEKAEV